MIAAITHLSLFSSKQCIIKQLLDSVFVISGIIKISVSVISLSLRLRLITLTSTLIIPDITKTSSNNCLISVLPSSVKSRAYEDIYEVSMLNTNDAMALS